MVRASSFQMLSCVSRVSLQMAPTVTTSANTAYALNLLITCGMIRNSLPAKTVPAARTSGIQGSGDKQFSPFPKVQSRRRGVAVVGHLLPGPAQDVDELVIIVTGREIGKFEFQEYQTRDVLQTLRFRIDFQCLLPNQRLHPRDKRVVIP